MFEDAKEAIKNSSHDSSIYVGCDSVRFKKNGVWYARYATVVIVHFATRHGAAIYHHVEVQPDYGNLRQRLMFEVMLATNAALDIIDVVGERHLEIHLDINSNSKYKSHVAMAEAIGFVIGNAGIRPKVKPDSWAASHASDHCARGKMKAKKS